MKKTLCFILMVMMMGLAGCSVEQINNGNPSGVWVMFDGEPLLFDSSVIYMGSVVGRVISRETGNAVTRVSIDLDGRHHDLKQNNMAAVVKNGRLHLRRFSGYGLSLPPDGCINGFMNLSSYRWYKFRHIINNINMSADQRAKRLLARSGLAG
jgi:hypothetical protein